VAFPNSSITDLIATGIDSRTGEIADSVLGNNPVLSVLKAKGRVKTASGGTTIVEELSFNSNPNGGAYEGYDQLPTAPADVISAAQYDWKQYAVPVVISGKEEMINSGKEALLDLLDSRLEVGEATMSNLIEVGAYGDGTGFGGKALTGLATLVEAAAAASQNDVVGGIDRATWAFWRNYYATAATSDTTGALVRSALNTAIASLTRGADSPDVILLGADLWTRHLQGAQLLQRFTDPGTASFGFTTLKYMNADVFLLGGITGQSGQDYTGTTEKRTALLLNSKYLRWRPHAKRNFVSGGSKDAFNQDAHAKFILFMGNLTCRGAQFNGRFVSSD
jgi:hypothetical protein